VKSLYRSENSFKNQHFLKQKILKLYDVYSIMKDKYSHPHHLSHLIGALFFVAQGLALAQSAPVVAQADRIYFIGDSTMATKNGYGDAVCAWLKDKAECFNLAKNGRSSKSFREEGLWDQAVQKMKNNPNNLNQWVLIQFGHNDQPGKPGRSTNLSSEYPLNLENYILDLRAVGAKPILVTPLIRRSFKSGQHQDDLIDWANSMKHVASKLNVPLIDLHSLSKQKVIEVGEDKADLYAESPKGTPKFDRTHLGPLGACVFGAMVLQQLPVATGGKFANVAATACE
jgi:lysophospholipase L1-like esterase